MDATARPTGDTPVDYWASHFLLVDNLMLSVVVDDQGRLVNGKFSLVSDLCEPVASEVTQELMLDLDLDESVRIGCFGRDLRNETRTALTDWVNFRFSALDEDGDQVFATLFDLGRLEQCL